MKKGLLLILSVVNFLLFQFVVEAKPMVAPDVKEAVVHSTSIVIAKYKHYSSNNTIDYFNGPIATYSLEEILKGAAVNKTLKVKYRFEDGSACLPEDGWQFHDLIMPKKGSSWILFVDSKTDGIFNTYRGNYGRWEATPENIRIIKDLIIDNYK
ncbi:MAG TPA: hypothetical protein PLZ08_00115 [Bacillota bacterium]|nr:hypothetical protein [Bacillota bacterium]HPO96346.1 hypothetical protein [Bacillota bacterium]